MKNFINFKNVVSVVVLTALVFSVGFFVGQNIQEQASPGLDLSSIFNKKEVDFSLIEDVWKLINEQYIGANDLDKEALIFGAIRGMVEALNDPHTVFFDRRETGEFLTSVSGSFEGVGIEIGIRDEMLTVIAPLKGTPAHNAGVLAGDKIVKIDGESTEGSTLEGAVSKIRGPKGTTVVLTVQRDGSVFDISIVRDEIRIPSVKWELKNNNIAYIEIIQFSETTKRDFDKLANEVLDSNATSIILDLRNNPGGFLDVSIHVAGWFLAKDKTVVMEESADKTKRIHASSGPGSLGNLNTVVLINEGSASAAEILAGALRDQNSATLVGEKTFGKGSVQALEELRGGTSLKLTVARWITPSGHQINGVGIEPDIRIEQSTEELESEIDSPLDRAIELLQ